MSEASEATKPATYRLLRSVALMAGAFALVVVALLAWDFSQRQAKNPLDSPEYLALKAQLAKSPRNEELKKEIRQKDLQLRQRYFRQRQFSEIGGWLLCVAMLIFVMAAKRAAALRRKVPMPQPQTVPSDFDEQTGRSGRWAVAGLAVSLILVALMLSLSMRNRLPDLSDETPKSTTAAPPTVAGGSGFSPVTEVAKQWPRFRGPGGTGICAYSDVPIKWNAASGEAIGWKVAVPLPGNSSPVVWNERVFLSGATEEKREVYCFDAVSGKLLWQARVPDTPKSAGTLEISEDTGFAAATMTTDGQRAYAIFANGDLAAVDFSGKVVWSRSLGIPKSTYGHAASLLMHERLLLVPFDQGGEKDKLSKLMALDAATGKSVWEARRDVPCSWPSPITIVVKGRTQVVTAANPWVIAYDVTDGKELWRAKCLRQDVGPSPTFAGGIVYAANEFPGLAAIRADGQGDVTETHILWKGEEGLPDTASPLATEKYVFLLASSGTLTCYDAGNGKVLWQKDFDASFNSSPSLVGNHVYLFGKEGKCWVIEPGPEECKIVAESDLGEECVTSPAFQPGRLYIRGKEHLFCIGKP